jgi:hypothetical protein
MDEPIIDRVPSTPPEMTCLTCGAIDHPTLSPGTWPHHLKASCAHCGQFLKWVSPLSPEEREERRQQFRQGAIHARPPSAEQLKYLQALGDSDPPPEDMAEASQRIEALVRKKNPEDAGRRHRLEEGKAGV